MQRLRNLAHEALSVATSGGEAAAGVGGCAGAGMPCPCRSCWISYGVVMVGHGRRLVTPKKSDGVEYDRPDVATVQVSV